MIDFAPTLGYMDMEVTPEGKLVEPDAIDEIIIDDSFRNTKAECVYNKLLNLSGGFRNAIQKFDGEFPVSHLNLKTENLENSRERTVPHDGVSGSPDYNITIILNNNSGIDGIYYRPNLMIAKTIVHEIIHAEMFRKLLSLV